MKCSRLSRCSFARVGLALAFLLCATEHAHAQSAEKRADELFAHSQKNFSDGDYAQAAEALKAAYTYSPRPVFLYSLGQAYRLNHDCKSAVKAYRDFLGGHPSKAQEKAVNQNIARCGQEDPSSIAVPAPPDEVKPAPVAPTEPVVPTNPETPPPREGDVAPPPPVHAERTPTYKKWWPWTILGVVVVGAGVGVGLGLGLKKQGFSSTIPDVGPGAAMATSLRVAAVHF